jgi:hypothetical protein
MGDLLLFQLVVVARPHIQHIQLLLFQLVVVARPHIQTSVIGCNFP